MSFFRDSKFLTSAVGECPVDTLPGRLFWRNLCSGRVGAVRFLVPSLRGEFSAHGVDLLPLLDFEVTGDRRVDAVAMLDLLNFVPTYLKEVNTNDDFNNTAS